jgi:hypothetical protein
MADLNDAQINRLKELYSLAVANGDKDTADFIVNAIADRIPIAKKEAVARAENPPAKLFLRGVGDRLQDWTSGAKMIAGKVTDHPSWVQEAQASRDARQPEETVLRSVSPLYDVGRMAPGMLIPGGGAASFGARAIEAGLTSGLENVLESGGDVKNAGMAAVGGALGNEVGRGISRFVFGPAGKEAQAFTSHERGPVHLHQVKQAQDQGIILTPGQRTDNPVLKMYEAGMQRDPFMAGPFSRIEGKNQGEFNRIARAQLGLSGGDKIDDHTLQQLHEELGREFDNIVGSNGHFPVSTDLYHALDHVQAQYDVGLVRGPELGRILDNVRSKADAQYMTVHDYQQTASDLAKMARNSNDPGFERAMYQIRDALDSEFDKSYGNVPQLQDVRGKWRALRDIERSRALDQGNFRPSVFYNYVRGREGRVTPQGGPLNTAAITGNYFKSSVPNSGTPTGQAIQAAQNAGLRQQITRFLGPTISELYLGMGGRMNIPTATGIYEPKVGTAMGTILPRLMRENASHHIIDQKMF